jgi:hypothetical protein
LGQNLHAVADVDMKTGHAGIIVEYGTAVKKLGEQIERRTLNVQHRTLNIDDAALFRLNESPLGPAAKV